MTEFSLYFLYIYGRPRKHDLKKHIQTAKYCLKIRSEKNSEKKRKNNKNPNAKPGGNID